MSSRAGSRLLVLVLCLSAVLGVPAAAHAGRAVTHDEVADAVSITYTVEAEDGGEEEVVAPAPEQTSVDIVRTVVQHRTHRLRVTVSLHDLVLRRRTFHFTAFRVVTPQAGYWLNVEAALQRTTATLDRGRRMIECRGLRWSVDDDTDKVTASVPTVCLDAPRWVQVGVGVVELDPDSMTTEGEQLRLFADDGHRAGRISENSIAKGPKVHRG